MRGFRGKDKVEGGIKWRGFRGQDKVERVQGVEQSREGSGGGIKWGGTRTHLQFLDKAPNFSIVAAFPFCLLFGLLSACA